MIGDVSNRYGYDESSNLDINATTVKEDAVYTRGGSATEAVGVDMSRRRSG